MPDPCRGRKGHDVHPASSYVALIRLIKAAVLILLQLMMEGVAACLARNLLYCRCIFTGNASPPPPGLTALVVQSLVLLSDQMVQ